MPCYHPITMYATGKKTKNGKKEYTMHVPSVPLYQLRAGVDYIQVPCGSCIGCRLDYSRSWAIRAMHEASLYPQNSFVTLTYAPAYLPADKSLHLEHIQKFFKRLRKRFAGKRIRLMYCGEYGDKMGRPHYHVILFNHQFDDLRLWSKRHGNLYYRSETLEQLWPFGMCIIGQVTFESCAYVARYMTKKLKGKGYCVDFETGETNISKHYDGRCPEFQHVSNRPGLGQAWIQKYYKSVYAVDDIVFRNDLHCKPPRYYDDQLAKIDPALYAEIKDARVTNMADKLSEQLTREEAIKYLKVRRLVRTLELDLSDIE